MKLDHPIKNRHPDFKICGDSVVVGLFILASSLFVGYLASSCDWNGIIMPWPTKILSTMSVSWMAPFGFFWLIALIAKDTVLPPEETVAINIVAFLITLFFTTLCIYLFMFKMYEIPL